MRSPYAGRPTRQWLSVTRRLLERFPLSTAQLVELVLHSWDDLFHSRVGRSAYVIGEAIRPEPQIMGFLLHELIPLNLASRYPGQWRRGAAAHECDAVHVPDDRFSFEIKTSSSRSGIFGNRSYVHGSATSRKRRSGFMLAANFGRFSAGAGRPQVVLVRFGWLDSSDWIGQKAPSGQQARLTKEAKAYKLLVLYEGRKQ